MPRIDLDVVTLKQVNNNLENDTNALTGTHFPSLKTSLSSISSNVHNATINSMLSRISGDVDTISQSINSNFQKVSDFIITQVEAYGKSEEEIVGRINNIISKIQEFNNSSTNKPISIFEKVETRNTENSQPVSNTTGNSGTPSSTNSNSSVASTNSNVEGKSMNVPGGSTNYKSYTNYEALTEKKNADGEYIYKGSAIAYGGTATDGTKYNTYTDQETGVRCVDIDGEKYYCAAMGTYYGKPGDTFKVTTDEGNSYNVIMCDNKGNDAQGKITVDGTTYTQYHGTDNKCLTEFYIDKSAMPESMKVYRDGQYIGTTGTYNSVSRFKGNVVSIEKY